MLEITRDTAVFTARDEHVGNVDRIIVDHDDADLTHLVVRKGFFLTEDKVIPASDIATATRERVNLVQDARPDLYPTFDETRYEPFHGAEADVAPDLIVMRLIGGGPVAVPLPHTLAETTPTREQDVRDGSFVITPGSLVLAADGQEVGRLDRLLVAEDGGDALLVVMDEGDGEQAAIVPLARVERVASAAVTLDISPDELRALPPYDPA